MSNHISLRHRSNIICFRAFLNANARMWPRFDEMRKLAQAKERQSNSTKRKSYPGNRKSLLQRRKRSLFSITGPSNERSAGSSLVGVKNTSHTENIGEFSSDDEQYSCPAVGVRTDRSNSTKNKHKSLEKASRRPRRSTTLGNSKYKALRPEVKLEDSTSQIKWSDSDSDIDDNVSNTVEQEPIGLFESPVKSSIKHVPLIREEVDSPVSIEDSPDLKPVDINQEPLKDEGSKASEYVPNLIDSSKKRRAKDIKGGLAEQCRKVVARERSSRAFWKHSLNKDKNEITGVIPNEEKPQLCLRVVKIENDFSLTVLKCYKLRDSSKTVNLVMPIKTIAEHKIKENDIIEVYPPFRTLAIKGIAQPVLLCAYYFKVVDSSQEMLGISKVCSDFDRPESDSLEPEDTSTHISSNNVINKIEENNKVMLSIETAFCNCSLFQPVTFSATVIKSRLTTVSNMPKFKESCDQSIIDYVTEVFKETSVENSYEVCLILKDEIGQVALLRLLLKDSKMRELCCLSDAKGKQVIFKQFILKDLKSISFNPSLLSILNDIEKNSTGSFLADVCYIFTDSDESSVSLNENESSSTFKSAEKLQSLQPSSSFNRTSFYARCLCILPSIYKDNPSSGSAFSFFVIKYKVEDENPVEQNSITVESGSSKVVCIKKLSTCYVPEFVTKSFLEEGKILFFKDVLENAVLKDYVLDNLSKICIVQDEKAAELHSATDSVSYGILLLDQEVMDTLYKKSFSFTIDALSFEHEGDTIVFVEGTISGIIDDSAVFWTVCGVCGLETNQPVTQATFYCESCRKHVKSSFHVQLEVNIDCKDVPALQVTVKLLEKTVFEYLPMEISDGFAGYDSECIIGKKFGRKLCYISSVTKQFGGNRGKVLATSMRLKEVVVAEEVFNYLEL